MKNQHGEKDTYDYNILNLQVGFLKKLNFYVMVT